MKYRIPCGPRSVPNDEVLQELGLAPDDREVLQAAYQHSSARLQSALVPLCAKALGDRTDLAQAVSIDSCRHILISTAATRAESTSQSAQKVALFMAGEGPRPDTNSTITEQTFLALAEESNRFEAELAEALGPEEAHRVVFSDRLCFTSATYQLGGKESP